MSENAPAPDTTAIDSTGCVIGVAVVLGIAAIGLAFWMGYIFDHARFEHPKAPIIRPYE